MRFGSVAEAKAWGQEKGRRVMFYEGAVLDVTQFGDMHPGGAGLIEKYSEQDISTIFHDPSLHRHDVLSIRMLESLEVGRTDSQPLVRTGYLDEDEPLMNQVRRLDAKQYLALLRRPHFFGASVRLFEMDFFEMFSLTDWKEIVLIYAIALGVWFQAIMAYGPGLLHLGVYVASCFVVWLLAEYLLHHFLFHSEEYLLNRFEWFRAFHFCLHGIHHVLPLDKYRILFPPIMGVPISLLIWLGLRLVLPDPFPHLLTAGITTGYLYYDMSHFAMHIVKRDQLRGKLRYHNRHHFADQEGNYGVTSAFFDQLFGTALPPLQ
jgi:4-hydroxysphinganine ceramide fatty acyl 2-hydroxylase